MSEITPRVRFAPSPTGYLHVGGARTALFNWLYARHFGGTLILRIEDTDFERSSEAMVEGILEGMRWLGLNWDEGPFFQSQRLDLYRATAEKLLASGHAYHCFCTKEELEQRRAEATAAGRPPMYDRRCRRIAPSDAAARKAAGEPAALRFAVPEGGSTSFDDAVFGKVEFANSEIEDFVLLRSDGIPTYHLSVVADDVDMRLTHIIRGADHLSNTPKQVLQYRALGAPLPVFAHVPLILGPDKTRLSKRHGATSVIAYKDMGIVPEAFRNFLSLLGWTPGSAYKDREIFSSEELIQLFGLDGISKSNAVFDNDKLAWFNTEYIRAYPAQRLLPLVEEEWQKAGFTPTRTAEEILAGMELLKPRARSLKDFSTAFCAYFSDTFAFDPAAVAKFLADANVRALLAELAGRYAGAAEFTEASTEQVLRAFAEEKGLKAGALINGSRVALTGQAVAPSLFAVMVHLGRERVVERLRAAPSISVEG
ncbi:MULTISPECIES: glutamate--tRNA ligase [Acidobacterium]|uniref:Glutamate--tRNA ligase n=1 Tax=Acidobacterium capsulatum (strain ATCC 51196 / DSM 11244 / BCRC 80197 / JCM 7670 / NBRC 15755 / NCIMB 13165 / 161) TaxID=240015 RepID=C1F761_ACIC5|nr:MULTISPECIES: glutamate--tRNA ligase [Acidobacterium]ACO31742.1 glutamate--tRNA ligase [Acidobacterium capsulatum ATCC 51196]HCT60996.1 glutamate--tRNA ligase [Acidobacterium sp.]